MTTGTTDPRWLPRRFVISPLGHPVTIVAQGPFVAAGVRFHPGTASAVGLDGPWQERRFEPQKPEEPIEPGSLDDDFDLLASRLEAWLLSRVHAQFPVRWHPRPLQSTTVDGLSHRLGIGVRRLERLFRRHMGLSPKLCLRILRFQRALQLIVAEHVTLSFAALEAGYADQAHFCREARSLTNLTPKQILLRLGSIGESFAAVGASFLPSNSDRSGGPTWMRPHTRP